MSTRQLAVDAIKMAVEKDAKLEQFEKREPLVQEVIAAANAPVSPRWADRVSLAARKLAEWSPT